MARNSSSTHIKIFICAVCGAELSGSRVPQKTWFLQGLQREGLCIRLQIISQEAAKIFILTKNHREAAAQGTWLRSSTCGSNSPRKQKLSSFMQPLADPRHIVLQGLPAQTANQIRISVPKHSKGVEEDDQQQFLILQRPAKPILLLGCSLHLSVLCTHGHRQTRTLLFFDWAVQSTSKAHVKNRLLQRRSLHGSVTRCVPAHVDAASIDLHRATHPVLRSFRGGATKNPKHRNSRTRTPRTPCAVEQRHIHCDRN